MKLSILRSAAAGLALANLPIAVYAQSLGPQDTNQDALNGIDTITVVGIKRSADEVSGAVDFIGPEELAKQNYSDINRILRTVPGVNLQEEDGYGLRPNIGLRGSGAERSSKVVIMEDGVLMAPAPYASPSAYYFPMSARMNAVEISKGPATVKYGPNTTAGAIHFFSTPIPKETSAKMNLFVSDQDRMEAHAWAGTRVGARQFDLGFLLETYQDHAQGYKDIARGETGFNIDDYVGKVGLYSKNGRHSLELKYQNKQETSNETYLGVSSDDFEAAPYTRYTASQLDQMKNDHETFQLTDRFNLNENWSLTTIAYRTEFARNWYKLNDMPGGSAGCTKLDSILTNLQTCADELAVLKGEQDSGVDALRLRANNRSYYATGIQSALGGVVRTGRIEHDLVASVRVHKDEVDRFQDNDDFQMQNGAMVLTTDGAPGTQANRLSNADALALYIEDHMDFGRLDVTAGLRYERVSSEQTRWSGAARTDATITRHRENDYGVWLPALSAKYSVTETLSVLGGVHRGFAAASVGSDDQVDPERSTVFEGGLRYLSGNGLKLEAIGFFNDYANMLGDCTNFAPCSIGDTGDSNNGGEVDVSGVEFTGSIDVADLLHDVWDVNGSIPISISYTYTDGEFKNGFSSDFDAWGDVNVGDELPYVPKNQMTLTAGYIAENWGANGGLNYVSKSRAHAGQGAIAQDDLIEARTLVDASAYYMLSDFVKLHIKAENLFDVTYIAARRPSGLRPGKPREIFAGLELDF